jgi:hypothetical protein
MVRKLDFHWNLRQLMAAHGIWKTTGLLPQLAERGVVTAATSPRVP